MSLNMQEARRIVHELALQNVIDKYDNPKEYDKQMSAIRKCEAVDKMQFLGVSTGMLPNWVIGINPDDELIIQHMGRGGQVNLGKQNKATISRMAEAVKQMLIFVSDAP